MNEQRRILITRLSHIGDCILTLPLACAIKEQDPQAFVAWVVQPPSHQLLHGHPAIDRLVIARPGFLRRPGELWKLREQLVELRCQVAVDPQSLTKSATLAWLSGARQRIGFQGPYGRELAPLLHNVQVQPASTHLADRTLELLRPLGITVPAAGAVGRFDLPVHAEAGSWASAFIRQTHLGCDFALINPGAGWISKRWPPRQFARVARYLGEAYRMPSLVVWAGEQEHEWARQIVEHSGGHGILAPPTNLVQLAAILRRALFFLGGDTGPLHLAHAVNTPCVALFGPTLASESGPYGHRHQVVQSPLRPARRHRKTAEASMRAIELDAVTAACDRLIHSLTAVGHSTSAA